MNTMKKAVILIIFLYSKSLISCDSYIIEDNGKLKVFTSGDPIDCDNGSKKFILKQKIIYCNENKEKSSIKKDCEDSIKKYNEILNKEDKNWFQKIFT